MPLILDNYCNLGGSLLCVLFIDPLQKMCNDFNTHFNISELVGRGLFMGKGHVFLKRFFNPPKE